MKLNTTNIFALLVLLIGIGCGQAEPGASGSADSIAVEASDDIKTAIEGRLDEYLEKTNSKEWDASFNYLHPTIFDIAPRAEMVAAFEQMDKSGFNILVGSADITDFEKVVTWENTSYSQFTYNCDMKINLSGEQFADPMMIELMNTQMRSQYGEEKVTYDSTTQTFDVDAIRTVWAITGPDSKWYFVEETPQLDMVLDQIVPDTVQVLLGL
ncbi:MAG: hypothetical protein KDC34_04620 [Saprospiraceae bacterium]|nr:hypothetical protein [Saprospiraceae bacterium]